jgi:hypothetical protein
MIFMAQQYHPKPISFVPPLFRRKFIAPDNPREMGTLVMLIGFAIVMVSAWANVADVFASLGKQSATGTRVAQAPYRSGNVARMVGVYVFVDDYKVPTGVRGSRVYTNKAKIPRNARVVWPRGRSQKAQVVFENLDHLWGVPVGLGVLWLGIWVRRKRVDAFEAAMGRGENHNEAERKS